MFELSFIWAGIIALAVLIYVILDGFDLGIGILFPFAHKEEDRDVMMNTIAPVWDGNETWLVMGGGGLLAVFPLAYAIVMPALYVPIIIMLLALIFRGVAFEYRWRSADWKKFWDRAFFLGSTTAAFMQGIALGALVEGIEVVDRAYAGGTWDFLTPFSVLTGFAVLVGYALLGSTWLILKTEGGLQHQMRSYAVWLGMGLLIAIGVVSIWTPFINSVYFERWFDTGNIYYTALVPIALLICAFALFYGLRGDKDLQPFLASLAIFVLSFIGIGISFYPFIVPPSLTIVEAAAPDVSLEFALWGTAILLPIILFYTGYSYWVFRGKVRPGDGYH